MALRLCEGTHLANIEVSLDQDTVKRAVIHLFQFLILKAIKNATSIIVPFNIDAFIFLSKALNLFIIYFSLKKYVIFNHIGKLISTILISYLFT